MPKCIRNCGKIADYQDPKDGKVYCSEHWYGLTDSDLQVGIDAITEALRKEKGDIK